MLTHDGFPQNKWENNGSFFFLKTENKGTRKQDSLTRLSRSRSGFPEVKVRVKVRKAKKKKQEKKKFKEDEPDLASSFSAKNG